MSDRRVCLLTGAGGLLGEEMCRRHASTYDIVAVHRSRPPAVASQEQWYVDPMAPEASLAENAYPVFTIASDLTLPGEVERVVELALSRFGRIDVLVNNAANTAFAPMLGSRRILELIPHQLDINVAVPMRLAIEVAQQFWRDRPDENRALRRGVVNISSTSGVHVYRGIHQGSYSASKAALNYLTVHMADELAEIGVRANALAPTSFPRLIPTEAVADAVVRLDNGTATGEVVVLEARGERRLTL